MQNYKNHRKMDILWVIAFLILVGGIITISFGLKQSYGFVIIENPLEGPGISLYGWFFTMFLPAILLIAFFTILLFKLRSYATKLQDRIIRQEVQFRHFVMTGKILDNQITLSQMIALRFAGDDEFLALCNKAASQGLAPKAIKEMITNWKADEIRV